jgi:hypothetical protein
VRYEYVQWWPAVVFGWPPVLLAVVLSVLSIRNKRPALLATAAVIVTPFSLYLGGTPRIGLFGFMIPVLLVGAAVAVRYRQAEIAWMFLVPVVAIVSWVANLVIGQ